MTRLAPTDLQEIDVTAQTAVHGGNLATTRRWPGTDRLTHRRRWTSGSAEVGAAPILPPGGTSRDTGARAPSDPAADGIAGVTAPVSRTAGQPWDEVWQNGQSKDPTLPVVDLGGVAPIRKEPGQ